MSTSIVAPPTPRAIVRKSSFSAGNWLSSGWSESREMRSFDVLCSASLLLLILHLVNGEFCQSERASWQCACGCCDDDDYCCVSCGSYWYAWLLMTIIFFICLCACLGCGSYGYRRYQQPLGTSRTVIPTTPPRAAQRTLYSEQDKLTNHQPSSYQPYSAMATDHRHGYRDPGGYPSELPPAYNPNQAPPPYSTH